jgi:hypothetical protein
MYAASLLAGMWATEESRGPGVFEVFWGNTTSALAMGTVWFWIVLVLINIALIVMTEKSHGTGETLVALLALAFLQWVCGVPILTFMFSNPLYFVVGVILYVGTGVGWSFAKWYFFVAKKMRTYFECRTDYQNQRCVHPGTLENPTPVADPVELSRLCERRGIEVPPIDARKYKWRIIQWMTYWPWSFVWTMFDDPIRQLGNWIFEELQETYQAVARRAARGMVTDFSKIDGHGKNPP